MINKKLLHAFFSGFFGAFRFNSIYMNFKSERELSEYFNYSNHMVDKSFKDITDNYARDKKVF